MIPSLQSLRFIFAIMIFLHHCSNNGIAVFPPGGACGVSFFIILSGFVMSAGYGEKVEQTNFKYKEFILKRLIRIYPLHILCLLGYIAIRIFHFSISDYLKLIPNTLLLQSWIPIKEIYFSGNAVSWCLSDFLFFYAIFPLLSKFIKGGNKSRIFSISIIIVITYLILALFMPESYSHQILYISPLFRLLDFIIGMYTYTLYIKLSNLNYKNKLLDMSFTKKSIIELFLICLVSIPVILYSYISKNFYYSYIWWFIMPELILCFALFNKRGGIFKDIKF